MKKTIKKYKIQIISAITGGIIGYLYWYKIGCTSESCPIISLWYNNAILGILIGYLLGDTIVDIIKKNKLK